MPTLGPAAFLVAFICLSFGYEEKNVARLTYEEKIRKILAGIHKRKFKSTPDFIWRYIKKVWLPLFAYCSLVYVLYQIAEGSIFINEALVGYYKINSNFHLYSPYPIISKHYNALVTDGSLRAETAIHIYSVAFNGIILSLLSSLAAFKFYVLDTYYFSTASYKTISAIFGILFSSILFFYFLYAGTFIFDAPVLKTYGRWKYNIADDNTFFILLSVFCAIYPAALIIAGERFAADIMCLIKGKPIIKGT